MSKIFLIARIMKSRYKYRMIVMKLLSIIFFLAGLQASHALGPQDISLTSSINSMSSRMNTVMADGKVYHKSFRTWYKKNNTTIIVIPDIYRTKKLDFFLILFLVLFIL